MALTIKLQIVNVLFFFILHQNKIALDQGPDINFMADTPRSRSKERRVGVAVHT